MSPNFKLSHLFSDQYGRKTSYMYVMMFVTSGWTHTVHVHRSRGLIIWGQKVKTL